MISRREQAQCDPTSQASPGNLRRQSVQIREDQCVVCDSKLQTSPIVAFRKLCEEREFYI